MNNKTLKPIPHFRSGAEQRGFPETPGSTDDVDGSKAKRAGIHKLKRSTASISRRLPRDLLERATMAAHRRDAPHQSPITVWLAEPVDADAKR